MLAIRLMARTRRALRSCDAVADELADTRRGAMIVVMTQSHTRESDIATAALRRV
jgi:hypothetical protein